MEILGNLVGVVLLLTGLFCIYRVKKRKFNRTNAYGVQQFSSFEGKLRAKLGDAFLWLAALTTIAAGTVVLAELHREPWGNLIYGVAFFWIFIGVFLVRAK